MKVWVGGKAAANSGGMYRVYEGLYKYLPLNGIEIVDNKQDADVVNHHISAWGDIPKDKPIVASSHGMLWQDHKWGKFADKVNLECLASYRLADVVTAPSHFTARAISRYTGANPIVVHHGIEADGWVPAKENGGYVLWNKARKDAASNPHDMNELAKRAADVQFYSTHGLDTDNVFTFGRMPPEDMPELVSQAGVYLATSLESGGPCFGVLEAMSCGVPVLSWNYGGTAEVLTHKENGYLAEVGNYEDLLEGLYYCLKERERLGQNARTEIIDNYQWKDTIQGYIEAYERAYAGWNDLVSIIIPCYNLGRFLPACLDSVLEQTYKNIEVIVIDDASTDNSWEIINDYTRTNNRIKTIRHSSNEHVSASRNGGIRLGKGHYILPLDADDRLRKNAVENMVRAFKQDRELDIVAGHLEVYHETALDGPSQLSGWPNNTSLKLQLEGYNRLPYASMYRKKVWERVGGYRTRIRNGVEDADFWTRALSLGYKAEIIEPVTLKYTHRDVSLGKTNDKGSAAWLSWFPYTYETCPATTTKVKHFSPPKVNIVIPVGPNHAKYVQACIDSVWAQTEDDWEVVVVNDTGTKLLFNPPGFVKVVDMGGNLGVAAARNAGVEYASADRIIFLDVDDTLQPHALQSLLAAHDYAGGWIYGDWYIHKGDGKLEYSESEDWNYDLILNRSLGPITGIYEKKHIQAVGGFTEDLAGWEDWDFHLKLLHIGVCGTRLKVPLITYNMHLGHRREENFSNRENLLQYIQEKHYIILKDKRDMACSGCGGKRTLSVKQQNTSAQDAVMEPTVELEYLGNSVGRVRIPSKVHRGTDYKCSTSNKRMHIFKSDLEYMLSRRLPDKTPEFKLVQDEVRPQAQAINIQEEPLVSQEVPVQFIPPSPVEVLDLEEHVVVKLRKGGYSIVPDILDASDAELLAVKGIGEQRVEEIREAVNEWKSRR